MIRHLKKSERTKGIPIMIVSAKELTREEVGYLNGNIEKIIQKRGLQERGSPAGYQAGRWRTFEDWRIVDFRLSIGRISNGGRHLKPEQGLSEIKTK